ncbi:nitroreductase family protein [Spirochaeta cellobiosiphila]|uniref:nitroreductase family protein n=1 Tax=Spirochaeta cellobiosiphila TaxID=504483 RepID=UPI0004248639|nr:nitroreductase family protein [Spirochaeta cellobiosiphila]
MALVFDRRSVNFFDGKKEISNDKLKEIIDLANTAPSAFNLQPWKIIAVKSEEAKKKLHPLAFNQDKVLEAPVTLIIVSDREGYKSDKPIWTELAKMMGEGTEGAQQMSANLYGTTEERKIKFAESNAGLLAMSIMYAAKHHGIDSHPMSGVDFDGLKKAYNLAENEDVVMLISLGYHDSSKEVWPKGFRKPFEELVEIL